MPLGKQSLMYHWSSLLWTYFERSRVFIECPVIIQYIQEVKVIPFPAFEIVEIVRRGDFNSASTKLHIDQYGIRDNRYAAVDERMINKFAM